MGVLRSMSDRGRLSLHIPSPRSRPDEPANLDHLVIPEAGSAPRPESTAPAAAIRDLAYGLIRVLDERARAVGAWDPRLDADHLRRGLRAMLLTRVFDERMFRAHRQGKTSFYIKSSGDRKSVV